MTRKPITRPALLAAIAAGVAALALATGALAHEQPFAEAAFAPRVNALLILPGRSSSAFTALLEEIRDAGGWPAVGVPPSGLLADLPAGADAALLRAHPGLRILRSPADPASLGPLGEEALQSLHAWNLLPTIPPFPPPGGKPMINDAFLPPLPAEIHTMGLDPGERDLPLTPIGKGMQQPRRLPKDARWYNTSEFLAGTIAVGVIFPESACTDQSGCVSNCGSGIGCSNRTCSPSHPADDNTKPTCCENWTPGRQAFMFSKVQLGLANLGSRAYDPPLRFPPTFLMKNFGSRTTSVEPIHEFPGSATGEAFWVTEILDAMGYTGSDHRDASRKLANDLRNSVFQDELGNPIEADWGYSIYVADALWDCDGEFPSGSFAWAWLGGPHIIMNSDNDGWEGSEQYVVQHESNHIFFALDEYRSNGNADCNSFSGYLWIQNLNFDDPNGTCGFSQCTMRADSTTYECPYSRGQMGLRDQDADGIIDIRDLLPQAVLTLQEPNPTDNPNPNFSGSCTEQFHRNSNYAWPDWARPNITINRMASVEYQVDGGPFTSLGVTPNDGVFNDWYEGFTFAVADPLLPGTHQVVACCVNDVTNRGCSTPTSVQVIDSDLDGDTVLNSQDNCPRIPNPGQEDADGDDRGDVCDNCVNDANHDQVDADLDLQGDACDPCPNDADNDADSDTICGDLDNCPALANTAQENADGDGQGDACDTCPDDPANDWDGDEICVGTRFAAPKTGGGDNCPEITNPGQQDADGDTLGDICDPCPNDPAPPLRPIQNLRVTWVPDVSISLDWDPSDGCMHFDYAVYISFDARPGTTPPNFPSDPSFVERSASDSDGDLTDNHFTWSGAPRMTFFFLVQDRGVGGQLGPLDAYGQ